MNGGWASSLVFLSWIAKVIAILADEHNNLCQVPSTTSALNVLLQKKSKFEAAKSRGVQEDQPKSTAECTPYFLDYFVSGDDVDSRFYSANKKRIFPPKGPHESKFLREVERVEASKLTPESFFELYVSRNRPVIIEGASDALFRDFPNAWTPDALMKHRYSDLPQEVAHWGCHNEKDAIMNVSGIFTSPTHAVLFIGNGITFDEIRSDPQWLLQRSYFDKLRTANVFINMSKSGRYKHFNLHLSNQGGTVPHSHSPTLNMCMFGAKRWIMVDPLYYKEGQQHEMEKIRCQYILETSPQKWFLLNASSQLDSLRVPYYDFIQEAGEAVYLPNYFTHATMDICRETVAVELKGPLVTSG